MNTNHHSVLHLKNTLSLPDDAIKYLDDFYHVIQAWDDFVDGDEMSRENKDRAIYASLVEIPSNPFFRQNASILLPIHSNLVLKWKASDTAELKGESLHQAYMWRAGFYDLVLQVVSIVHGPALAMQSAHEVMALYGESYEEYVKEFEKCLES